MQKAHFFAGIVAGAAATWTGCAAPIGGDSDNVDGVDSQQSALSPDCAYVKCAVPLCATGQHLVQSNGSCCPTCVGQPSKCEAVLCPMVMCAQGYQLVRSPGQCCGTCRKVAAAPECSEDADCPQLMCIACPCPVSRCQGRKCVTSTPDATSCGGN